MINAIKTTRIASNLNLRICLPTGGAQSFSWLLNGVPLVASTNRKSFTGTF
jgi:hypothetical protein